VAVQRTEQLRREVDGAPLVRFRRLDPAETERALDVERPAAKVEVSRLMEFSKDELCRQLVHSILRRVSMRPSGGSTAR